MITREEAAELVVRVARAEAERYDEEVATAVAVVAEVIADELRAQPASLPSERIAALVPEQPSLLAILGEAESGLAWQVEPETRRWSVVEDPAVPRVRGVAMTRTLLDALDIVERARQRHGLTVDELLERAHEARLQLARAEARLS